MTKTLYDENKVKIDLSFWTLESNGITAAKTLEIAHEILLGVLAKSTEESVKRVNKFSIKELESAASYLCDIRAQRGCTEFEPACKSEYMTEMLDIIIRG